MPRFTLKTLLIAAAVTPVAAYVLYSANSLIASFVMATAAIGWIASLNVWLGSEGELREFARGFTLSTLAYGAMAFGIVPATSLVRDGLGTTRLLHLLHEGIAVQTRHPEFGIIVSPERGPFIVIGEFYYCVVIGLAGGILASWLYHRGKKGNQIPTKENDSPSVQ